MNEEIEERLQREGLRLADNKKRGFAFFIDELLLTMILMVALWDSFENAADIEELIAVTNMFVLEYMALKIIYQAFFIMQYGASLGKIAMKIRVVEVRNLQTPNVISALNRAIFRVISEMIMYLGFLWGLLDPTRQTWHDKTAKTLVIDA